MESVERELTDCLSFEKQSAGETNYGSISLVVFLFLAQILAIGLLTLYNSLQ